MRSIIILFLFDQFFVGWSNDIDNFSFDPDAVECFQKHKESSYIKNCKPLVNDPDFLKQWILVPGEIAIDLHIVDVWIKYGFYGQGVVVINADDGLDTKHPDLKRNYNSSFGFPLTKGYTKSCPDSPDERSHGTMSAGIIGMEMNNGICGVGVAPRVILGAARVNDRTGCVSPWMYIIYENFRHINIVVHGYGLYSIRYFDNSQSQIQVDFENELRHISLFGNNGRGTLQVYPSGNGKEEGTSCAMSSTLANIYAIVVAGTTPSGNISSISHRCANVMVSAPQASEKVYTTGNYGRCGLLFGGTSASVTIVGGVLALTYEAKPDMTWREAQHLLSMGCTTSGANMQNTFITNGAGFKVSLDYGFGVINALKLVTLALNFQGVPPLHQCSEDMRIRNGNFARKVHFQHVHKANGCSGTSNEVTYLEHVQLKIVLTYPKWRMLEITLYSPQGTKSALLEREEWNGFKGNLSWTFDSIFSWGESPIGHWSINVRDVGDHKKSYKGVIQSAKLVFYGTKEKPRHY